MNGDTLILSFLADSNVSVPWMSRKDSTRFCWVNFTEIYDSYSHVLGPLSSLPSIKDFPVAVAFALPRTVEQLQQCQRILSTTDAPYFINLPAELIGKTPIVTMDGQCVISFSWDRIDSDSRMVFTAKRRVLCGNNASLPDGLKIPIGLGLESHKLPRTFYEAVAEKYPEMETVEQ